MTLPLVDSWDVKSIKGPKYRVGPTCSNPTCHRFAEHAHHMVRHSQQRGQTFDWVEIDGRVFPNLAGLCVECHDLVTGGPGGHKAAIRLNLDEGVFYWSEVIGDGSWISYAPVGPLDPQPPAPDSLAPRASDEEEPESCPFCGQAKARRRGVSTGTPRRRKSWGVPCPDDEAEHGAVILDTLYEELAPVLHVEPTASGRYYVVMPALYYARENLTHFLKSLRGVGE